MDTPKWAAPVAIAFCLQAITATIYIARLGSQVEQLSSAVKEIRTELMAALPTRYTAADAIRDRTSIVSMLDASDRRIELAASLLTRRIETIEKRIERLESKPGSSPSP